MVATPPQSIDCKDRMVLAGQEGKIYFDTLIASLGKKTDLELLIWNECPPYKGKDKCPDARFVTST